MASVVVVGGGVAGLGAALALAGAGHEVAVVERDSLPEAASPADAFEGWQRRGAPQARHSHAFLARLRNLLRDRAPDLLADLLAAGAAEVDLTAHPPPALAGMDRRPGDEDLVNIACRRTTFEWVLRGHVAARGVALRTASVAGLTAEAEPGGPPRVTGVRLDGGGTWAADVVVEAAGRRSRLPGWLAAAGAGPVEETEEPTGIVYSSRFYRCLPGGGAPPLDRLVLGDLGHLKYALFPGDNGTFSITFGIRAADADLRGVLRPEPFTAVAQALALRAWLAPGASEPITGVEVMGGLVNRLRRFSPGGVPAATGVYAVGDSSVCTNPLYGRGCALALVQAFALADVLAAHPAGGAEAALAYDGATAAAIEPWYRAAVAQDEADRADAAALAAGHGEGDQLAAIVREGLLPAARTDPVVYRAFVRAFNLLDPPGAMMADPEVVRRVMAAWRARRDGRAVPGDADEAPGREELLAVVAAARRA